MPLQVVTAIEHFAEPARKICWQQGWTWMSPVMHRTLQNFLAAEPRHATVCINRSTGQKHTEGMFAAAALLESYLRQIQSIEGNLREADENIDTVREVLHRTVLCRVAAVRWELAQLCQLLMTKLRPIITRLEGSWHACI